jgi:esterase/lipase superfamily enzyme
VNRRELTVEDVPVLAYGHWGRPLLVFPSEQGAPWDYESNGMIEALAWLIEAGRLKVYCVSSFDSWSWADRSVPTEERARRHAHYERWIADHVSPFIQADCGGGAEIIVTGCSLGAFHAANFTLRRADLFPLAICLSGVFDVSTLGWGDRGDATYFNNPMDYVANLHGDHLEWLRDRASVLLVCGQGQWEDTTGALDSTTRFADVLVGKGIRVELDLWGHDIPHDWPSWRKQISHHLPRFC